MKKVKVKVAEEILGDIFQINKVIARLIEHYDKTGRSKDKTPKT